MAPEACVSMTTLATNTLKPWARKYIWWETPDVAASRTLRVIAQLMNIGDYDDVQALLCEVGEAAFKQALAQAEAGQFNERSWAYWHYRLGLARPGQLPPMPRRHIA